MNHLINSLKVEMQCPNEGMAFDVRHHFTQNMQAEMIEVMGDICTKYSAENEWLRIDKLEIVVGQFENAVFSKSFKAAFAKQFEKILLDKINKMPQAEKKDTQIKSLADTVRYFLLNGILPWWVNKNDFDLNDAVLSFLIRQKDAATLFFNQQKDNQQLWQRVALQLNNEAKETIISYILTLQTAQQMLIKILKSILEISNKIEVIDLIAVQENINDIVFKSATEFIAEPLTGLLASSVLLNGLHEIIKKESAVYNEVIAELNKKITLKDDLIEINKSNQITENKIVETNELKKENDIIEIEKYLVQQAGVVLLSPFFKPFFTNLKLLENGKWISKEAQIKAVHLLHFISTGLVKVPEYNVMLEKVLCGLPISFPVPLHANLTIEEMEECNAVIMSAIEHWTVLKSTSVQGFRQTFLQREGILKPLENSWLLQIERKTLDVLLEKIPWGFNTIFLQWLNKIINVEW